MTPSIWFKTNQCLSDTWVTYLIVGLMVMAAVLAQWFLVERARHPEGVHSPRLAWLRAGMFFCCALVLSTLSGVLPVLVSAPVATAGQLADPLWWGLTALGLVAVIWGYVIWWPRGTLTHGRTLHLVPSLLFGLVWGACSAQVLLSFYAIVEGLELARLWTALIVVFLFSGYSQVYQSGWWDIHVSPPHNIRAWNARKVLFGHLPFLAITLGHFTLYGNVAIFILLHALAMACAAVAMRFPPFWAPDGPPVSRETALGV